LKIKKIIAIKLAQLYLIKQLYLSPYDLNLLVDLMPGYNFKDLIRNKIFLTSHKSEMIYDYLSGPDIDILLYCKINNKDLKRIIMSKSKSEIINGQRSIILNLDLIHLLPIIDVIQRQQLLIPIFSSYNENIHSVKNMFKLLSFVRALKLFKNDEQEIRFILSCFKADSITVNDTKDMLMAVKNNSHYFWSNRTANFFNEFDIHESVLSSKIKQEFRNRCNSIQKLHDWLSYHVVNNNSLKLTQPKILPLNQLSFNKNLEIMVPDNNNQLVEVGSALSMCVGNGTYLNKILNNQSMILFILDKKTKETVYYIELDNDFKVLQAKGFKNNLMPFNLRARLHYLILITLKGEKKFSAFWNTLCTFR
jgi:hypothetical protein